MKIKNNYKQQLTIFFTRLNDIRFVGQLLFVVIVLLISWSGVKSIQTNYGLQKQITALNQQNGLQQLQNDNLKLQNQYYQTSQYLELSARQNFGMASPGEQELIVPEQVALAHPINQPTPTVQASSTQSSHFQRNFKSWVDFFLHRSNSGNCLYYPCFVILRNHPTR